MKMKQDHYNQLASAVKRVIADNPNALQEYQKAGLSMLRYRWDVYHMACSKDHYQLSDAIYQYCNDNHIDTALRNILGA